MTDKTTPAFPTYENTQGSLYCTGNGMSLRNYFAAKAMQGMFANPDDGHNSYEMSYDEYLKEIARCAYLMADAMLEASND